MQEHPTDPFDPMPDVPPDSIARLEEDLRKMGATDLSSAAALLTSYKHLHTLSSDELGAVLSRFAPDIEEPTP